MNEQQIYVFCGPDMTGKTEISKAWANYTGIKRFKATSEHQTFLKEKDKFINQLRYADTRMVDFLDQTGYSVIFDRAWPCEWVYSRVFNRETDSYILDQVDAAMAQLGAKIIVTSRTSYEGIVDDIDPKITEKTLKELDFWYNEYMQWTKCQCIKLVVDDENINRQVTEIKMKFAPNSTRDLQPGDLILESW